MQGSVLVRILELRVLIVIDCSKITFATILYTLLKKISMFIGMTSEGGGAVAFPVMTLALSITPEVARDFSLMIQSCGEKKYLASIQRSNHPTFY